MMRPRKRWSLTCAAAASQGQHADALRRRRPPTSSTMPAPAGGWHEAEQAQVPGDAGEHGARRRTARPNTLMATDAEERPAGKARHQPAQATLVEHEHVARDVGHQPAAERKRGGSPAPPRHRGQQHGACARRRPGLRAGRARATGGLQGLWPRWLRRCRRAPAVDQQVSSAPARCRSRWPHRPAPCRRPPSRPRPPARRPPWPSPCVVREMPIAATRCGGGTVAPTSALRMPMSDGRSMPATPATTAPPRG
jgi:hypothetical protein